MNQRNRSNYDLIQDIEEVVRLYDKVFINTGFSKEKIHTGFFKDVQKLVQACK